MRWSIEHKLPLFATILLVAVAIAQLTIGYGEVRQASLSLADKRLPLATKVLADLFQIGQGRVRITALAKDPAIVAFLRCLKQIGEDLGRERKSFVRERQGRLPNLTVSDRQLRDRHRHQQDRREQRQLMLDGPPHQAAPAFRTSRTLRATASVVNGLAR